MIHLILLSMAILLFGSRFYYIKKKKLKFNIKEISILLFLLYLLFFIKIILLNDKEFTLNLGSMIKQAQLIPSLKFTNGHIQIIKTIIITIPFGFFISAIFSTTSDFKKIFQYGFFISFIVETLKLFKLNEIWSINHIILMLTGFLTGSLFYRFIYKFLKIINKEIWLDTLKDFHPQPFKKNYKLICSLIIFYILGVYTCLIYQTYPLSILQKSNVIKVDNFEINLDEKLSYLQINGYYKTNFNRLNHLFSTKVELHNEPIYNVYTLIEPYKPQTDINYGILLVGWTDQPLTVDINYKDVSYLTKVQSGLFTLGYPNTVSEIPILDRHTRSAANLSITFYDESGNVVEIPYYKEKLDE